MGLIVTRGYLIARYDYDLFDEILVFINNYGNKFTCYSNGSRKITSKNSRALLFGNFLEFEFFYTNNDKKISKLKKVVTLNEIDFDLSYNLGILIANDILVIKEKTNYSDYIFYQTILINVYKKQNDLKIAVFAYLYYLFCEYKKFKIYKCKIHNCYSNSLNLFDQNLFICNKCTKNENFCLDDQELKFIIFVLNSKKFEELQEKFFMNKYNINWKKIYDYLNYIFNHYIRLKRKEFKGKKYE